AGSDCDIGAKEVQALAQQAKLASLASKQRKVLLFLDDDQVRGLSDRAVQDGLQEAKGQSIFFSTKDPKNPDRTAYEKLNALFIIWKDTDSETWKAIEQAVMVSSYMA